MHAWHRLAVDFGISETPRKIKGAANPWHLATFGDLKFTDDRNVVFSLTRKRTSVTADAGIEVDRHPPLVSCVTEFIGIIEGVIACGPRLGSRADRLRIRQKFRERALANNVATFHTMMLLRAREQVGCPGFVDLNA